MVAGHYSAALLTKAAAPRAPFWALVLGAQFIDVLWALCVLVGIEKLRIDPSLPSNPLDLYFMPYTHSLAGALFWGGVAGAGARFLWRSSGIAAAVAVTVASHWLLDLLVHRPDLPLWPGSAKLGLGIWNYPVPALLLELGLLLGSAWILAGRVAWRRGVWIFAGSLAVIQVAVTVGPPPLGPAGVVITALVLFVAATPGGGAHRGAGGLSVRYVVYGAGAIGGVVGARLFRASVPVVLVARGAHLDAIRRGGLVLRSPEGSESLAVPALAAIPRRSRSLRTTSSSSRRRPRTRPPPSTRCGKPPAPGSPSSACRTASRARASRCAASSACSGRCSCSRPPTSSRASCSPTRPPCRGSSTSGASRAEPIPWPRQVATDLRRAGFASEVRAEIQPWQWAKLLTNLLNALHAACGPGADFGELPAALRAEGEACLRAAAIPFVDGGRSSAARSRGVVRLARSTGRSGGGGSSWQSLARGTGTIEADYLNGEIALLGGCTACATPLNAALQSLAARLARERRPPASLCVVELRAALLAAGAPAELAPAPEAEVQDALEELRVGDARGAGRGGEVLALGDVGVRVRLEEVERAVLGEAVVDARVAVELEDAEDAPAGALDARGELGGQRGLLAAHAALLLVLGVVLHARGGDGEGAPGQVLEAQLPDREHLRPAGCRAGPRRARAPR